MFELLIIVLFLLLVWHYETRIEQLQPKSYEEQPLPFNVVDIEKWN